MRLQESRRARGPVRSAINATKQRDLSRGDLAHRLDHVLRPGGDGRGVHLSTPRDVFYVVLFGPAQEFARPWLDGRTRTSIRTAERSLAEADWRRCAARLRRCLAV